MNIIIDDTTIDTLTVKFWIDCPGPLFVGPVRQEWVAQIGLNLVESVAGFGDTPLLALKALIEEIPKDEEFAVTNAGRLMLR